MYMNGLRGIHGIHGLAGEGDDWGAGWKMTGDYVGPADTLYANRAASDAPPTANTDWIALGTSALSTWGTMRNAELQSKTAIAVAPYQSPFGRFGIPGTPPSPYYAASPGVVVPGTNLTPILILAAIGIAA